MIAKAIAPGSGFGGTTDYIYDGKLKTREENDKKAAVILHSDNLRVAYSHAQKEQRKQMKRDFISQAEKHRDYGQGDKKGKYVGHHVLSFSEEDHKKLTPGLLKEITKEYVEMAGLNKTQFAAISHDDTNLKHIHIVFNRAMNDGTKYPEWKEKTKTAERGVALSLKHHLSVTGGMKKYATSAGVLQLRMNDKDIKQLAKDNLLGRSRNMHHLGILAGRKNILIEKYGDSKLIGGKEYRDADLAAVFALNRSNAEQQKELKREQQLNYQNERGLFKHAQQYQERDPKELTEEKEAGKMYVPKGVTVANGENARSKRQQTPDHKRKIKKIEKIKLQKAQSL